MSLLSRVSEDAFGYGFNDGLVWHASKFNLRFSTLMRIARFGCKAASRPPLCFPWQTCQEIRSDGSVRENEGL